MRGFFDASTPDLPNANFDIIVGVLQDAAVDAFTIFLPISSSQTVRMITDIGLNPTNPGDKTSLFGVINPVVAVSINDPALIGLRTMILDNGVDNQWFVGYQSGIAGGPPQVSPNFPTSVSGHGGSGGQNGSSAGICIPPVPIPGSIGNMAGGALALIGLTLAHRVRRRMT